MKGVLAFLVLSLSWLAALPARAQDGSAVQRGEYIFRTTGGCSCHTDGENGGAFMAGGRPIKTPFGLVYGTNITPDPKTGIGSWSDEDFIRAMTEGIAPDGSHYFPVFPYTSFTGMSREDLLDLKAFLFSIPAVEKENVPPDLIPPLGWRPGVGIWKALFFNFGPFQAAEDQSPQWNRGAYLATALAHCGECHTPRNFMGGLKADMPYAGSAEGPEGQLAPNITPDEKTGIGEWSAVDIIWYLQTGLKPDGDDTQGLMSELIENGYRYLSAEDLQAIAAYLRSLEPLGNEVTANGNTRVK